MDGEGAGNSTTVLAGLQWVLDNKDKYNIRVINLSVGTADAGYNDPMVKSVEAAWDSGIVVVIAAGNNGPKPGSVTSPGISRKVITVGASDDNKTVEIWGDTLENFSGRGPTSQCVVKPDIIAPGANIVSCLTNDTSSAETKDDKVIMSKYVSMSGTSMSTPIVSGGMALLLEKYPDLSPTDVKYNLRNCTVNLNYPKTQQGWGLLDLDKLVRGEIKHVK